MELILKRIAKRKGYTIGHLYVLTERAEKTESTENYTKDMPESALKESLNTSLCETLESSAVSVPSAPSVSSVRVADTLEPTWRDYAHGQRKIPGRSAIPEGRYAVVISWSPKFKAWLPVLLGGPEFNMRWQGIRIHAGNTVRDTQGCILVGENKRVGELVDSRLALQRVKQLITEAKERGEAVHLTIV